MPKITFLPNEDICPDGATIEVDKGTSICRALQILVPLSTSIVAPSGQISSFGKNVIFGISFYSISSIPLPAMSDFILLFILRST